MNKQGTLHRMQATVALPMYTHLYASSKILAFVVEIGLNVCVFARALYKKGKW